MIDKVFPKLRTMEQALLERLAKTLEADGNLKFAYREDTGEMVSLRPEEQEFLYLLPGNPQVAPGKLLAEGIRAEIQRRDKCKAAIRSMMEKFGLTPAKEEVAKLFDQHEKSGRGDRPVANSSPVIRTESPQTRPARQVGTPIVNNPRLVASGK